MVAVAAVVGLITSVAACATATILLRRLGVMDVPNTRSSHAWPIVRGVGIGTAFGCAAGLLTAGSLASTTWPWRSAATLVLGSLGAGAIGLVDDLRGGTSFKIRLGGQVGVASAAALLLGAGDVPSAWRAVVLVVGAVWIVGYVNAFNFMDGINGISGVSACVAGATFAVVGGLESLPMLEAGGAALAAASLGFLPFNFPAARAFLGDVGSYFLGAWIALLAYLAAINGVHLAAVAAPLVLYLVDVGFTLVTRLLRGEQWHAAHRDHTYQRLAAGGLGHTATTLMVLTTTVALAALGLASMQAPGWRAVIWPAGIALLGAYLAAPWLLGRRHGSQSARAGGGAPTLGLQPDHRGPGPS